MKGARGRSASALTGWVRFELWCIIDNGLRKVRLQRTMQFKLSSKTTRTLVASIMLLAFVARALVPQGFMPASDRSLSLEICPDGFPVQFLAHSAHHHMPSHSNTEHCVFGSASASGPVPHVPPLACLSLARRTPVTQTDAGAIRVQLVYLPHARAPPAAA